MRSVTLSLSRFSLSECIKKMVMRAAAYASSESGSWPALCCSMLCAWQTCASCKADMCFTQGRHVLHARQTCALCMTDMCFVQGRHVLRARQTCASCKADMCFVQGRHVLHTRQTSAILCDAMLTCSSDGECLLWWCSPSEATLPSLL